MDTTFFVVLHYNVFFFGGGGGVSKIITKIKGTVRNYIWGKEQVTHTKVGWEDCRRKQKGDLGLVDLQHVTTCVFSKWIMYAIEPAASDLQILLRYRFAHFKPQPAGGGHS